MRSPTTSCTLACSVFLQVSSIFVLLICPILGQRARHWNQRKLTGRRLVFILSPEPRYHVPGMYIL